MRAAGLRAVLHHGQYAGRPLAVLSLQAHVFGVRRKALGGRHHPVDVGGQALGAGRARAAPAGQGFSGRQLGRLVLVAVGAVRALRRPAAVVHLLAGPRGHRGRCRHPVHGGGGAAGAAGRVQRLRAPKFPRPGAQRRGRGGGGGLGRFRRLLLRGFRVRFPLRTQMRVGPGLRRGAPEVGVVDVAAVPQAPSDGGSVAEGGGLGTLVGHQAAVVLRAAEELLHLPVHVLLGAEVWPRGEGGQGFGASAGRLGRTAAFVHGQPLEGRDHLVVLRGAGSRRLGAKGQGEEGGPGLLLG